MGSSLFLSDPSVDYTFGQQIILFENLLVKKLYLRCEKDHERNPHSTPPDHSVVLSAPPVDQMVQDDSFSTWPSSSPLSSTPSSRSSHQRIIIQRKERSGGSVCWNDPKLWPRLVNQTKVITAGGESVQERKEKESIKGRRGKKKEVFVFPDLFFKERFHFQILCPAAVIVIFHRSFSF